MTERLIDAVCPHCGRVGTTVRVVLQEDGHTKLSRRCTDCGGECIHTFDHGWLASANNKELRAENEKLRAEIERLTRERDEARAVISTLEIVGKADDDERAQLRAEVERLRKGLRQGFPIRYETAAGCLCPAGAKASCQNSFCPRRNPPGVTCGGGKP